MRTAVYLCIWFSVWAMAGVAEPSPEWPRFRGENGSGVGIVPNLPARFTANNINWEIELPGMGHSSPVVAGNRIFVSCTLKDTAIRLLLAINVADGKVIWEQARSTETFPLNADNSYTSATPTVDALRVYMWWSSPEQSWLAALDQKTGREVWRKELGGFVSQHGAGSSPIVFEDSVILDFSQETPGGKESYTICVDSKNGATRWRTPRLSEGATYSTPCIYQPADGGAPQLILVSHSAGLTSLDPHTGKMNWEMPGLMPKRCIASPIVTPDGLIIAQCGEGISASFVNAVKPSADGKSAQKVWEIDRAGGYIPTPVAVEDRIYLWKETGLVTCVASANGKVIWSQRVDGPFYASPVCVNGRLYNITRRGDLVVLSTGDKFEQLARIPLGEGSFAPPAIAGGRMYLRTFSHLISVGE